MTTPASAKSINNSYCVPTLHTRNQPEECRRTLRYAQGITSVCHCEEQPLRRLRGAADEAIYRHIVSLFLLFNINQVSSDDRNIAYSANPHLLWERELGHGVCVSKLLKQALLLRLRSFPQRGLGQSPRKERSGNPSHLRIGQQKRNLASRDLPRHSRGCAARSSQ